MYKVISGVIGFFIGGWLALWVFALIVVAVFGSSPISDMTTSSFLAVFIGPVVALLGAITGAVAGVRIASGGKDKPADAAVSRPRQGVISPDTHKPQLGQFKCPFCQSTTFRVEDEAGLRRCSDCHTVLPNYILGNA